MKERRKILAVIPARGGSRSLPGKNIKNLGGMPLIAWTVKAAKASRYIDRIIVSTDDEGIVKAAKDAGAEAPFMRPAELATDKAGSIPVVLHAMKWLEDKESAVYDIIVLLQPTSPLRSSEDIDVAIDLLFSKKASSIVSVCETEHSPLWANTLPDDGDMKDFLSPKIRNEARQALPKFYRINGAVYAAHSEHIKNHNSFFGDGAFAYIMPQERSVDIDTELDFKFAEAIFKTKGMLNEE